MQCDSLSQLSEIGQFYLNTLRGVDNKRSKYYEAYLRKEDIECYNIDISYVENALEKARAFKIKYDEINTTSTIGMFAGLLTLGLSAATSAVKANMKIISLRKQYQFDDERSIYTNISRLYLTGYRLGRRIDGRHFYLENAGACASGHYF